MAISSRRGARLSINVSSELRELIEAAAAARGLSTQQYVSTVLLQALQWEALKERKLTSEERQRGLDALARLQDLDRELLNQRGGVQFPDSGDLINEVRDERTRELMNEA